MKIKKLLFLTLSLMTLLSLFLSGCTVGPRLPEPRFNQGSKVYDTNGKLITTLFKEKRTTVKLKEVSPITRQAIIAVEDSRFYQHHGISFTGIARAAWKNLRAGEVIEGGSTITQQTAKNLFLGNERTFSRKFLEFWYAIQLERKYSKDEILEMYLNQIYFGEGAYGIEEAAQTYFGKPASQLDLAESAMLAGLPKAPSKYSPFVNWQAAKNRQKIVLGRMVETKVINQTQADEAYREELHLNSNRKPASRAPYFINEIVKYVTDKYEDGAKLLYTGGLKIETTLDLEAQKAAETAFLKRLQSRDPDLEGGLVALDPKTGYVLAMVGGKDYATSKFNRALQALRQPGSAFKPFVYTAALEQGYTAATTLTCEPVEFRTNSGIYKPTDFGSQQYHYRPFTLKEAVTVSDNVIAVKLAGQVGPQNAVDVAKKMGINSSLRPYISIALGTSEVNPLEMAAAYAAFANGGFRIKPVFVKKITDSQGRVLENNLPSRTRVLDEKIAYIMTDMLKSVVQPGGTASIVSSILPRPAAGKTGTTQNYADAWFVGYTPELVAAVYIGYDNNRKSVGSTGGRLAAPIWAEFAARALKDRPVQDFPKPPGVVEKTICADTGLLATPYSEKTIKAFFIQGTEPTQYCPIHGGLTENPPFGGKQQEEKMKKTFSKCPEAESFWNGS
ncbi:transglycosylase domain-containing protein [Thermincola ferriacetica]